MHSAMEDLYAKFCKYTYVTRIYKTLHEASVGIARKLCRKQADGRKRVDLDLLILTDSTAVV